MNVRTLFTWPVLTAALVVLACLFALAEPIRFAARRVYWAVSWLPLDSELRNRLIADRAALAFRRGRRDVARCMLARHPVGKYIFHTLERDSLPVEPVPDDHESRRAQGSMRALVGGDVPAFETAVGFDRSRYEPPIPTIRS